MKPNQTLTKNIIGSGKALTGVKQSLMFLLIYLDNNYLHIFSVTLPI